MKRSKLNTAILLILITVQISCAQRKSKYYTVTGTVTTTQSYCGGARPTDEMLAQLKMPKPDAGRLLFIKSGKENVEAITAIKSFTTDSLGNFKIKLKKGTYCIIEAYKSKSFVTQKNDSVSKWDSKCLFENYSQCDYQFTVTNKNIDNVNINFFKPCPWAKPCLQYSGPMPP